ncbi:hypothetical protein GCM10027265_38750 [Jatrophihabitans fulvus]
MSGLDTSQSITDEASLHAEEAGVHSRKDSEADKTGEAPRTGGGRTAADGPESDS